MSSSVSFLIIILSYFIFTKVIVFFLLLIGRILKIFRYDPTAVLDFLWALTCNPKLWQGREKYSTKNDMPENILLLTSDQLLVLVMYVIDEAVILDERQSRKTAISHMESRLDLLICSCSAEDEQTIGVVKYLAREMVNRNE